MSEITEAQKITMAQEVADLLEPIAEEYEVALVPLVKAFQAGIKYSQRVIEEMA